MQDAPPGSADGLELAADGGSRMLGCLCEPFAIARVLDVPAAKRSTLPLPAFRLSLHIRHPSVSPEDISRELRLEADESFAAGEPRRSRRTAASESVHSETYWVATLDPELWPPTAPPTRVARGRRPELDPTQDLPPKSFLDPTALGGPSFQWRLTMNAMVGARSLGAMLVMVCGRLALRHREFLARLQSEGGSLTLRATVSPRALHAFKIPPQVSQWLYDLGMTLEFECLGG